MNSKARHGPFSRGRILVELALSNCNNTENVTRPVRMAAAKGKVKIKDILHSTERENEYSDSDTDVDDYQPSKYDLAHFHDYSSSDDDTPPARKIIKRCKKTTANGHQPTDISMLATPGLQSTATVSLPATPNQQPTASSPPAILGLQSIAAASLPATLSQQPTVSSLFPILSQQSTTTVSLPAIAGEQSTAYSPPATPDQLPATNSPTVSPQDQHAVHATRQQKSRARTKAQKIARDLSKHPLQPTCPRTCMKQCSTNGALTDNQRKRIRIDYWSKSFPERRLWLDSHINIYPIQRHQGQSNDKRQTSLKYYLPGTDGTKHVVCKTMFMATVGMKTDGIITEFRKWKCQNPGTVPTYDFRGRHEPSNKSDHEEIIKHIESYNPQISHYVLEKCPKRRYLESNLNVHKMWKDYKSSGGKLGYDTYNNTFLEQNIGFYKPNADVCFVCKSYEQHNHDGNTNTNECEDCNAVQDHLESAKEMRVQYQKDKEKAEGNASNKQYYAVDMQKVFLLPKQSFKEHLWVSRLIVFNETFSNLAGVEDICVLWHEAVAGRCATDVTSAFVKVINMHTDTKEFVFWADNCTAQNKNWVLFSTMVKIVNMSGGPDKITIKYLTRGHTYLRCDMVHGCIGKTMRAQEEILDWHDTEKLVAESLKTAKVVTLTSNDMYDFEKLAQVKGTHPKLKEISTVQFRRDTVKMYYKKHNMKEFLSHEFMTEKHSRLILKQQMQMIPRGKDRGIKEEKKNQILEKLVAHMPQRKKTFWQNLAVNNSSTDLVSGREPDELSITAEL